MKCYKCHKEKTREELEEVWVGAMCFETLWCIDCISFEINYNHYF